MSPKELREILAAMAEFDVVELEASGVSIRRENRARGDSTGEQDEPYREPTPVVFPVTHGLAGDRGARMAALDELESELERIGA